ncbi:MAG: substrate-binding domain-containing protein, partial [Propionicimonas sp.]|uniref:substrate-binding domain-containing protein n=1 Tax=Propionicimonas sp. TaxID=1955623 RepID=UPI002B20BF3A
QSRVPAVDRAVTILDQVARDGRPLQLAELTRQVALPKSTVFAVCQALVAERLLSRGVDGSYRLGPAVAELAAARRQRGTAVQHIGMSVPNSTNPFFDAELAAARSEAQVAGAAFDQLAADQDVAHQARDIVRLTGLGVELLVVDPVASDGLEEALDHARERGVTIVSVNGATAGADATVVTDNAQAGALVARHLAARLGGQGRVVIVGGAPVTAITDRIEGFRTALAESPGVDLVGIEPGDNSRAAGREAARRFLASTPDVAGVFAINDLTALGVIDIVGTTSSPPKVVSVDGSAAAIAAIASGGPLIATAAQEPDRLARIAVRTGLNLANGTAPAGRTLTLPTRLITADDLASYQPWGLA